MTIQSEHIKGRKYYGTPPKKHHKTNNRILDDFSVCVPRPRPACQQELHQIQVYVQVQASVNTRVTKAVYIYIFIYLEFIYFGHCDMWRTNILFQMISWFPCFLLCAPAKGRWTQANKWNQHMWFANINEHQSPECRWKQQAPTWPHGLGASLAVTERQGKFTGSDQAKRKAENLQHK